MQCSVSWQKPLHAYRHLYGRCLVHLVWLSDVFCFPFKNCVISMHILRTFLILWRADKYTQCCTSNRTNTQTQTALSSTSATLWEVLQNLFHFKVHKFEALKIKMHYKIMHFWLSLKFYIAENVILLVPFIFFKFIIKKTTIFC